MDDPIKRISKTEILILEKQNWTFSSVGNCEWSSQFWSIYPILTVLSHEPIFAKLHNKTLNFTKVTVVGTSFP